MKPKIFRDLVTLVAMLSVLFICLFPDPSKVGLVAAMALGACWVVLVSWGTRAP